MLNQEILKIMGRQTLTPDEEIAIQTCLRHRTALLLAFGDDLIFKPDMPDDILEIMVNIMTPKLSLELQRMLGEQPETNIMLTCIRYINAGIISELKDTNIKSVQSMLHLKGIKIP